MRLALAENEDVPAYLLIKLPEDEDILIAEKANGNPWPRPQDDDPDDEDAREVDS